MAHAAARAMAQLAPNELDRWAERFLRYVAIERGLSAHSVAAYRRDLARYVQWLSAQGRERVGEITAQDARGFVASLRDGTDALAPSSVARMISTVRGFHRFLTDEEAVQENVAQDLRAPKQAARLPKALTVDEVARLLTAARGESTIALRDSALLELLYATGARISEIVNLNVDDVADLDVLRVRGKGDKQRIIPVGSYARAALEQYLVRARPELSAKGSFTPALFLGARGARLSRQSAWHVLANTAARAELRDAVSPHTLRHSFATHMLQGGADVRVVQELLGHSSVATTQIYTLVTRDALRDMYLTSHPRALAAGTSKSNSD